MESIFDNLVQGLTDKLIASSVSAPLQVPKSTPAILVSAGGDIGAVTTCSGVPSRSPGVVLAGNSPPTPQVIIKGSEYQSVALLSHTLAREFANQQDSTQTGVSTITATISNSSVSSSSQDPLWGRPKNISLGVGNNYSSLNTVVSVTM